MRSISPLPHLSGSFCGEECKVEPAAATRHGSGSPATRKLSRKHTTHLRASTGVIEYSGDPFSVHCEPKAFEDLASAAWLSPGFRDEDVA